MAYRAAAEHLAQALRPYNVLATLVPLEEALKPRPLSDEEAETWCGAALAGRLDENVRQNARLVGYNLPQPTVLIGNQANNPLIQRLVEAKVLPYAPSADLPGRARGFVAWNLMTLGHDVEAVACIADDPAGLTEAVGTLFAFAAGLDPVTPLALPAHTSITPATRAAGTQARLAVAWRAVLPDRVESLAIERGRLTAVAANGTETELDDAGRPLRTRILDGPVEAPGRATDAAALPKELLRGELRLKQVLSGAGRTAVAYWGGRLQTFDAAGGLASEQQLHQEVTALAWAGDTLAVGLADGVVLGLRP